MSNNAQRIPFNRALNIFAEKKIADAIQIQGKALPAKVVAVDGAIVTVSFDIDSSFTLPQVTIPLFGPIYIRYPIQIGDLGVVLNADARLGGVSGLGGATSTLTIPGNLTALLFLPISNTAWSSVDPNSLTMYGPNGCVLRDTNSDTVLTLTPNGIAIICQNSCTVATGGCLFSVNASGDWHLDGIGTANLQDSVAHTSPAIMHNAWAAFISIFNNHSHPANGAPTSTPYTGGSIAP